MSKITDIFKHKHRISILCPFHFECTPSCLIDIKKGTLECVGCGKQANLSELDDATFDVVSNAIEPLVYERLMS